MPDQGQQLGVDLYRLYKVAKDYLPSVASLYKSSADTLHTTSTSAGATMADSRPSFVVEDFQPADSPDLLRLSWLGLAETTWNILSTTNTNLEDCAHALKTATDKYANADAAAAEEFRHRIKLFGDPSPNSN